MNEYLIPANTKRGDLIFGLFRTIDLIILASGVSVTILFMLLVPLSSTKMVVFALTPAVVCGCLVIPMPNYHNMLVIISEAIEFFTHRQKYIWKGWCAISDEKDKK